MFFIAITYLISIKNTNMKWISPDGCPVYPDIAGLPPWWIAGTHVYNFNHITSTPQFSVLHPRNTIYPVPVFLLVCVSIFVLMLLSIRLALRKTQLLDNVWVGDILAIPSHLDRFRYLVQSPALQHLHLTVAQETLATTQFHGMVFSFYHRCSRFHMLWFATIPFIKCIGTLLAVPICVVIVKTPAGCFDRIIPVNWDVENTVSTDHGVVPTVRRCNIFIAIRQYPGDSPSNCPAGIIYVTRHIISLPVYSAS